ncbi:MAG: efflux RND transporter periplasmic adaptor subunit [Candidatus Hydrogenedentota bacterium]
MKKKRLMQGVAVGVAVLALFAWLRPTPLEVSVETVERRTVREYITEDAKTLLDCDYLATMPVSARVTEFPWQIGDRVEAGARLVYVDTHPHEQEIRQLESAIAQTRARITGVDVAKPKPEEIESARLRGEEMADALAMAQREANVARVDLEDAQREYERVARLYEEEVVSESAYDDARRALDSAGQMHERAELAVDSAEKARRAAELAYEQLRGSTGDNEYLREAYQYEIDSLEAQLTVLNRDRERLDMRAPFEGYILEEYIDEDRPMAAGEPVVRLGDLQSIEIEAEILSEEIGQVEEGAEAVLSGQALPEGEARGEVKRIYPHGFTTTSALGIEEQRFIVRIAFDNTELSLRPGTSLDVDIVAAEADNVIAVPERAIFRCGGGWHLFRVENARAVLTPVTVGLRSMEWAEIQDGVEEGDTIVSDPVNDLEDRMAVRPE